MKNMFYNYDHPNHFKSPTQSQDKKPAVLNNDVIPYVLRDIKGNEIGISVKQGTAADIYFNLTGTVDGCTLEEFISESTLKFTLYSRQYQHDSVLEKTDISGASSYVIDDDGNISVIISLTESETSSLERDSYLVELTADYGANDAETGSYVIYASGCGLLVIR